MGRSVLSLLACTLTASAATAVVRGQEDASSSSSDGTCAELFSKCGGDNMTTVECCNPEATCFIKNRYYASCVPPSKLNTTWDGRPLSPGEDIPMDLYPMKEMKGLDSSCEDDTCVMKWEQCGGEGNYTISAQCCEDGTSCIVKSWYYAQCVPDEAIARKMDDGWDGRALVCEEMPADLAPMTAPMGTRKLLSNKQVHDRPLQQGRRLLDFSTGGYGDYGSDSAGEYGSRDFEFPTPEEPSTEEPSMGDDGMPMEPSMMEPPAMSMDKGGCDNCQPVFEQCGGGEYKTTACCVEGSECIKKNEYYAQCLTASRAARNVEEFGWDGSTVECGITDILQGPPSRRLLQMGSYGDYGYGGDRGYGGAYGDYGSATRDMPSAYGGYGYGSYGGERGMPGEYGAYAAEGPAPALTSDCDGECLGIYEQCGGGTLDAVACCEEGTVCTKKHQWYAQCLTPTRAARNVEAQNWDGSALECGSTELNRGSAPPGFTLPGRRLMNLGAYGTYGGDYGYGSAAYGDYGSDSRDMPSAYGGSGYGGYGGSRDMPSAYGGYGSYGGSRDMPSGYGGYGGYGGSRDMPSAYGGYGYGSTDRELPMDGDMPAEGPMMDDPMMAPMEAPMEAPAAECNGECRSMYEQCGGGNLAVVTCCEEGTFCIKKHQWYAQCLTETRGMRNVETQNWDGKMLECGSTEMTRGSAPPGYTLPAQDRRRLASSRALSQVGGCDDVNPEYGKCAGSGLPEVTACEDGLVCVKKNNYYGQCLTPIRAAINVALQFWDGTVLECGTTDLTGTTTRPAPTVTSREVPSSEYGYGGDGAGAYGYGDRSAGAYGYGSY